MKKHSITVNGQQVEARTFPDEVEPARASVSLPTKVGKYNKHSAHVSVTIPCYEEEVPEALNRAQALADEKLTEIVREIQEAG